MGKRILIWRPVEKGNELDIFGETNYSTFYKDVSSRFGNICPNWGNKLWFQGLYSEIDNGENQISFRSNESTDQINNLYDLIIYPMANFFGKQYVNYMAEIASLFSNIKIPVYVIACGAQAKSYDDLEKLVKEIGEQSKVFISAIYNTGGEFALRGNFTKEFFSRLGFSSAVVTGCPSMYQLGRDFRVNNEKVSEDEFRPLFNGNMPLFEDAILGFEDSVYIDQDTYFSCLYDEHFLDNKSFSFKYSFYRQYGIASAKLLAQKRIRMIADMNDWYSYIKNGSFNYAFGSRIHGSIMAILAGVPATLLTVDTRTQEMGEFFDIPCISTGKRQSFKKEEIYELYLKADYTKFNQNYEDRYLKYQNFLLEKGIVDTINQNNKFFNIEKAKTDFEKNIVNTDEFNKFAKTLKRNLPLFEIRKKIGQLRK